MKVTLGSILLNWENHLTMNRRSRSLSLKSDQVTLKPAEISTEMINQDDSAFEETVINDETTTTIPKEPTLGEVYMMLSKQLNENKREIQQSNESIQKIMTKKIPEMEKQIIQNKKTIEEVTEVHLVGIFLEIDTG